MLATICPACYLYKLHAIAKVGHVQAHMIILYFTTKISVYSAKFLFSCGNLNKPLQLSQHNTYCTASLAYTYTKSVYQHAVILRYMYHH